MRACLGDPLGDEARGERGLEAALRLDLLRQAPGARGEGLGPGLDRVAACRDIGDARKVRLVREEVNGVAREAARVGVGYAQGRVVGKRRQEIGPADSAGEGCGRVAEEIDPRIVDRRPAEARDAADLDRRALGALGEGEHPIPETAQRAQLCGLQKKISPERNGPEDEVRGLGSIEFIRLEAPSQRESCGQRKAELVGGAALPGAAVDDRRDRVRLAKLGRGLGGGGETDDHRVDAEPGAAPRIRSRRARRAKLGAASGVGTPRRMRSIWSACPRRIRPVDRAHDREIAAFEADRWCTNDFRQEVRRVARTVEKHRLGAARNLLGDDVGELGLGG